MENGHLYWIFPLKMVIFHSYVSLQEGNSKNKTRQRECLLCFHAHRVAGLWYVCHKFVQYIYANPKAMCMCFLGKFARSTDVICVSPAVDGQKERESHES